MTQLLKLQCALLLLLAVQIPVLAQEGTPAPLDYEVQKKALKATRVTSHAEIRSAGPNLVGRVVELEGEIKGSFLRGGAQAVLFHTRDGEVLSLEAPAHLAGIPGLRAGSRPRILVKVEGSVGRDVALTLLNATTAPSLFRQGDAGAPVVLTPMTSMYSAGDAVFFTGPEGATVPLQPALIPKKRAPEPPLARNPTQRSSYIALARRYNPRLAPDMADYIAGALLTAAEAQKIDPRFLAAVVAVESAFDPYALSSSGAMGLGQIMPFNHRGLGISNAWDPMQNLQGAARMLRNNLDRFASKPDATLLAVAAYHAGGNAVMRAGNKVPPKAATQKYVWKVYHAYKALAPDLFQ